MASGKGNTLSNAILDHVLGGGDYTRLATVYIALFTTAPTAAGGGVEVSGTGYARVAVANNNTNFPVASNQQKKNGAAIDFGTAGSNWGTIVAAAVMSAANGGDILYWGTLAANKTVNSGDGFRINANNLTLTEA
jgi:hypothetical protein